MASLRHRRFLAQEELQMRMEEEEEEDDGHNGTADSTVESSSSQAPCDLEVHSMTAKGIKHLCSELLEIKKASEEEFRRNVYRSYLTFVRMFEEAGDLEKDVGDLKRHVVAQRRLIQDLINNLYSSIIPAEDSKDIEENNTDVNACSPTPSICDCEVDTFDALDILLSEHRMDQALQLLELESQALERVQNEEPSTRAIASRMSALSARKARVADRFASLADNPRTPRPELHKALSGLCRLGDTQRANQLLFKFYRASLIRHVDELRCSKELSQRNYIKELACTVFSSILQAARSFTMLHGHPSSYASELIRWAREEIEDFSLAFYEYVKSISEASEGLVLALEAANCALSYCYLLRPLKLFLEEDLIELIVPCMEEVLKMYAKNLKGVIRLLVASDAWVLGRFLISGILRVRSPTSGSVGVRVEHCLLTSSGRKFVTLMQEVVEDVSPLLNLGMKNSVLQLVAELFREYMHSIVEAMPRKEGAFQHEAQTSTPDQQYMWQLSVLINCTTLVSLFPVIAHGIFKGNETELPSVSDIATQRELDSLILFIKEATGQVWTCFCQQFIRDTMSSLQTKPRTSSRDQNFAMCLASSPQGMIPSFAFQVLFLRVRQLNNLYGTILTGEDGTMKKLLQELMEALILWLSDNIDSWIHHPQNVGKDMLLDQIQLDVHFLLEFALLGGFSSDYIRTTASDLLRKAEEKVSSLEQDINGVIHEVGWATNAARHAVKVLMGNELAYSFDSQEEAANVKNEYVLNTGEIDMARNGQEGQNGMMGTWSNEHVSLLVDEAGGCGCDGKSLLSSTDEFESVIEDDHSAIEDSENGEDKVVSANDELFREDVHGMNRCGGGDIRVRVSGLGGSEMHGGAVEAQADDDSSCSFTTSPELLQQEQDTLTTVVSAEEGTSPVARNEDEEETIDEGLALALADTGSMGSSSTQGRGGGGIPDLGCSRRGENWDGSSRNSRRRPNATAAADKGTSSSRNNREALSRGRRPRWR